MPKNVTLVLLNEEEAEEAIASPIGAAHIVDGVDHPAIDLGKTWDGIHYLLTGQSEGGEGPGAFLLVGGRDVGRGRVFLPNELSGILAKLTEVSESGLGAAYHSDDMEAKHVQGEWHGGPEGREFADLARHFASLWAFLADAHGQALFVQTI